MALLGGGCLKHPCEKCLKKSGLGVPLKILNGILRE
jgi:hypothetical protein